MADARDEAPSMLRPAGRRTEAKAADARTLSAHERALGSGAMRFAPPPQQRFSRAHFVPVQIRIGEDECHDLARASKKEWLITTGLIGRL